MRLPRWWVRERIETLWTSIPADSGGSNVAAPPSTPERPKERVQIGSSASSGTTSAHEVTTQ